MNIHAQPGVDQINIYGKTLSDLVRYRADQQPNLQVYEFVGDDGAASVCTCAELEAQAMVVASCLQAVECQGRPVLIFQEPGLDYIYSFYGCILAGAIAVPVYPPLNEKGRQLVERLVKRTGCTTVVASERIRSISQKRAPEFYTSLHWIVPELDAASDARIKTAIEPGDIALIQFTSGSTSDPKGVQLTHQNLMANSLCIQQRFEHTANSQGVIWLPPYHDMGLIGGILQPLYSGFPVTLMAPITFIESPRRWLEWITRRKATTSGGPNFAYDLCVDRIPDDALPHLDLSSWNVAFTGSETVSEKTLRRFHERFSPCGFRWEAFFPCYGLAESALFVSGGPAAEPPAFQPHPDRKTMDQSSSVVSCGAVADTTSVLIVDPKTSEILHAEQPGEVWIQGESVSRGYYNDPENNRIRFNCIPEGEATPYYRTGDLGFLCNGDLYITGRIYDALNHRGRNIFTTDMESELSGIHDCAIPQGVAVFSLKGNEAACLCVVQEVRRSSTGVYDAIAQAIHSRIQSRFGIRPEMILLAARGTIPKTTSGKVKRTQLAELASNTPRTIVHIVSEKEKPSLNVSELNYEWLLNTQPAQRKMLVLAFMKTFIARALESDPSMIDGSQQLDALGVDSIRLVDLKLELDNLVQQEIDVDDFMSNPTVAELASIVCKKFPGEAPESIETSPAVNESHLETQPTTEEPVTESPVGAMAPGPGRGDSQGDLYTFRKNPFDFMEKLYRRYGGVVRFHLGETLLHLVSEWEDVQRVHLHDNDAFCKGMVYDPQRNLMGNSVLTAEEPEWAPQRKALIPPFMNRVMPTYLDRIEQKVALTIEEWGEAPEPICIAPFMKRIALGSVLDCFLNEPWGERAEQLYQVIEHMDDYFQVPQQRDHAMQNANYRSDIESFNQIVDSILEDRLSQPGEGGLLPALKNNEQALSALDDRTFHALVKDLVITVLIAGFDTTSTTLTWFFYCMATHPDIQDAVAKESSQQGASSPLLKCCILETLRLYPPLWFLAREAARDAELGGFTIPKGSIVLTSPYIIHRNPWEWPRPTQFDPQRFKDQADSIMNIPSYLPFGMGQRACLGRHFAMVELTRVLSRLLNTYRFQLESPHPLTLASTFTLRPANDLVFTLSSRRNGNGG
jgi:acyl-CoA synthetase (AMP-forming)/AMP-acid ligase II/cytochrome P450/acyl carrier protein